MGFGIVPSFKSERRAIGGILRSIDNIWSHLNVEIKHHDTTSSGDMLTTPFVNDITDIAQGITGGSQDTIDTGFRDGDKIRVRTINVKYSIELDAGTGSAGATKIGHVMLIKHYGNFSGVAPVFNEIYDSHSNNTVALRLRRNEHKRQYKILYYRRHYLSDDINNGNTSFGNIYYKPKSRVGTSVEWEDADGDGASNGKYYLLNWGGTADALTWNYTTRMTYVDN